MNTDEFNEKIACYDMSKYTMFIEVEHASDISLELKEIDVCFTQQYVNIESFDGNVRMELNLIFINKIMLISEEKSEEITWD